MSLEAVLLGDSWYIIVIVPIFWDVSAESLLLYHVFCDSEGALQSLTESLYIFLLNACIIIGNSSQVVEQKIQLGFNVEKCRI